MGTVASAMLEHMGFEHRGFLITDPEDNMLTVLPARHRESVLGKDLGLGLGLRLGLGFELVLGSVLGLGLGLGEKFLT